MNKLKKYLKKLWKKPAVKIAVMGAVGASGGILVNGDLILNAATMKASLIGAVASVWGLYVQKPEKE